MRFAFIDVEKAIYPLWLLCRVLRVSRSGYYAWRDRKPSRRALEDEQLRPKVAEAFKTGRGTYGSPRVRDELVDLGFEVGRRRVARLMRELDLQGVTPRKFRVTTDSNHRHPIAANVLDRNFEASRPNEKWVTDIERHEALTNRAVMKGHRPVFVAANAVKLRAARSPGRG